MRLLDRRCRAVQQTQDLIRLRLNGFQRIQAVQCAMGNETRQRTTQIMVRVSPEEKSSIRSAANKYSLSMPAYLRTLGLGFAPKSTIDQQAIAQLAKLHGDLGRVGGLLKRLLNDPVAAGREYHPSLRELIVQLSEVQHDMKETIGTL